MSLTNKKTLSLTKALGFILIGLSALAWITVFIIPFLELEVLQIAGIIAALIIFAEICFFIAILLLGKPFWNKLKQEVITRVNKARE